jgi:putative ABC transport system permease protein
MRALRAWFLRLFNLFGKERRDRDLTAEMESHLQMHVDDNIRSGMSPEEARRQALIQLGGVEQAKESYRDRRGIPLLETTLQDVRYGLRMLRKNPGFTAVAVLTLALGIGANTAIFSVVNGVLLRPLPFPRQDRLLMVWERDAAGRKSHVGWATITDWNELNHSFTGIAAISQWLPTLVGASDAQNLIGFRVSADFFDVMGVQPQHGRGFLPAEDVRGNQFVVVLSHGLWQRRFGSDPAIVGKSIRLGSFSYTVVGVLPADFPSVFSFDPSKPADIYTPLAYDATLPYACRDCRHLRAVARLMDGVSMAHANAEMDQISESLFRLYPTEYETSGTLLTPLKDFLVGDVRPVLWALLGSVSFVLLIACVNVANLLVGWAARRHREVAVRAALGAGRTRLIRQFLTESILISFFGGALGLFLAFGGVSLLQRLKLGNLPRIQNVHVDGPVFAFTLGISLLAGIAFGLAPAFRASRLDLNRALNETGKSTAGVERNRLRNLLVLSDVALALVLLTGAGLMMKSFVHLLDVNPGFDPSHTLTLGISLWGPKADDAPAAAFYQQVVERVRALPGVESAGAVSQLPLGGNLDMYGLHVEGKMNPNPEKDPSGDRYSISPGYLRAMRIPLISGREIEEQDRAGAPLVALVNESAARQFWPGEDPIGRRLKMGDTKGPWRTVVGVVGDVLHKSLDAPHTLQIYLPHAQFTDSDMLLVVRTSLEPSSLAATVRGAIAGIDPQAPITNLATMEEVVSASVAQQRFGVLLFGLFAAIALLLAAVGMYGVISYGVAQRTHEIGIRMALGARRSDVMRLIVEEGMKPALVGAVVGLAAAIGLTRLLASLLYGVTPTDPVVFASVSALLVGVALLACYIPARRAVRVHPMIALRYE